MDIASQIATSWASGQNVTNSLCSMMQGDFYTLCNKQYRNTPVPEILDNLSPDSVVSIYTILTLRNNIQNSMIALNELLLLGSAKNVLIPGQPRGIQAAESTQGRSITKKATDQLNNKIPCNDKCKDSHVMCKEIRDKAPLKHIALIDIFESRNINDVRYENIPNLEIINDPYNLEAETETNPLASEAEAEGHRTHKATHTGLCCTCVPTYHSSYQLGEMTEQMGHIYTHHGYTHSASDGSVARQGNLIAITYGCAFHPLSDINFGGQILNGRHDVTAAEIIGIIKTIAFLQKQKAFRISTKIHVHHVDNGGALLWAMNLAEQIKEGAYDLDYAELTSKIYLTPEHSADASHFVLALQTHTILFRHQRGHTENDNLHVGAILNRIADKECSNFGETINSAPKGMHKTDAHGKTLSNIGRLVNKNAKKNKELTGNITITPNAL